MVDMCFFLHGDGLSDKSLARATPLTNYMWVESSSLPRSLAHKKTNNSFNYFYKNFF